jgi:hypothetical protein
MNIVCAAYEVLVSGQLEVCCARVSFPSEKLSRQPHLRKSWRNISSLSDISELFHENSITNILEKSSPLYWLMPSQKYFEFSKVPYSVIYDERFGDLSGRLSADCFSLFPGILIYTSLVYWLLVTVFA